VASTQKLVEKFDARIGFCGRLILWLFALLLLTRFSVVGAALTVAVVAGQVFLGLVFVARYRVLKELSALGRVGLGFCLGVTISTFFYIFVVTFTNRYFAILGQIGLLIVALVVFRFSRDKLTLAATDEEKHIIKWIAVVTLLGLSPDWFWPLPVAAVLAASIYIFGRVRGRAIVVRLSAMAVCGAVAGFVWMRILDTRPQRPWFADDRFAEIFSFSLGRWGMSHNPMMMGESISYHWFSFAWVGSLANLTTLSIETALTQFGPMVIALICVILGYSIARVFAKSSTIALCAVGVSFVVDTERLFRGYGFHAFQLSSFSQFFSLAFGLAVLLLIVNLRDEDLNSISLAIGIIFTALIGSKSSSGLVVLFGLGGVWLYLVSVKRSLHKTLKLLFVGIVIPTIFAVILFFGDPRNGTSSVIRRPGWPAGVSRDLWDVYNGSFVRYLPILIFLTLALSGLALLSLATLFGFTAQKSGQRKLFAFLVLAIVVSFLQMWIAQAIFGLKDVVGESDNTLYAPQFINALCILVVITLAMDRIFRAPRVKVKSSTHIVAIVVGVFLVVLSRAWKIELPPSYLIPLLTSLKPAIPFFGSLIIGAGVAAWLRVRSKTLDVASRSTYFFVASTVSLVAASLTVFVANFKEISFRQQDEWQAIDLSNAPSTDLLIATSWLNANSEAEAIVATKVTSSSPPVSLLVDRREFAGFWATVRLASLNSANEAPRREMLSAFTGKGDCESAKGLRQNDVDFVLVDLTNVETPDVDRCADEVFRNETVVIYSLK